MSLAVNMILCPMRDTSHDPALSHRICSRQDVGDKHREWGSKELLRHNAPASLHLTATGDAPPFGPRALSQLSMEGNHFRRLTQSSVWITAGALPAHLSPAERGAEAHMLEAWAWLTLVYLFVRIKNMTHIHI